MTASPIFWRGTYHVRITGARDTKRRIPASAFGDVACDRKSKRADRIARKYADGLEELQSGRGRAVQSTRADARVQMPEVDPARRLPHGLAVTANEEVMLIGRARVDSRQQGGAVETRPCMSLAEIGALFLSRNRAILDPKTLRRYECTLKQLVAFFGDERPDQIHVGRLEAYRDHRLESHWTPRLGTVPRRQISPRTVHGELVFCVQLLGFGFDRKIETGMAALPVRKAPDVADRVRTRGRVLTIEEFWRAYEAAGSLQRAANRFQRLLALALTTMLRSDALLRLVSDEGVRWVDLISRTVTIPPQFVKKGRGRVRKELTLPLCEWAVRSFDAGDCGGVEGHALLPRAAVDGVNDGHDRDGMLRGVDPSEVGYRVRPAVASIKPSMWGAPVASVQSTLNRIAQIAGIRHFSLHDIRATGATYLLNRGVQKIAVDRLIGHATAPNDARYYQVDQLATEAVRLFDDEWNAHRGVDGVNVVAIGGRG